MDQKHIGIDFDNTIVLYDKLFYEHALEKGLISKHLEKTKNAVRNSLIKSQQEEVFTEMQGFVYGKLIEEAPIQPGIQAGLYNLIKKGYKISIISHKTKFPIIGKKYDLHQAAKNWLEIKGFLDPSKVGIKKEDIYFNTTFEAKLSKIKEIGCNFFIDDLLKVLNSLDNKLKKIYFSPSGDNDFSRGVNIKRMKSWEEVVNLITNY